jgi:catabolite regulation protein CreA
MKNETWDVFSIDLSIQWRKLYLIYNNKRKNLIYLLWFVYTRGFQKMRGRGIDSSVPSSGQLALGNGGTPQKIFNQK